MIGRVPGSSLHAGSSTRRGIGGMLGVGADKVGPRRAMTLVDGLDHLVHVAHLIEGAPRARRVFPLAGFGSVFRGPNPPGPSVSLPRRIVSWVRSPVGERVPASRKVS